MQTTIEAKDLQVGQTVIGDRMYPAGTLDYLVQSYKFEAFPNGNAMVTVTVLTGQPGHKIERTIAWSADDKVILGRAA